MTREYVSPGGFGVSETGSRQYVGPGGGVSETVASVDTVYKGARTQAQVYLGTRTETQLYLGALDLFP